MKESLAKLQTKQELEGQDERNNWYFNLPLFIEFNQNHWHRSIKMSPNQAKDPTNHQLLRKILWNRFYNQKSFPPKYKINDRVRIHRYKSIFEKKSNTPNSTKEIFEISEVKNTVPVTYILKDENGEVIKGGFNEQELVKTDD